VVWDSVHFVAGWLFFCCFFNGSFAGSFFEHTVSSGPAQVIHRQTQARMTSVKIKTKKTSLLANLLRKLVANQLDCA
jgi:hypothetical protein